MSVYSLENCTDVCIQLIFQGLNYQEKLLLGRCNKRLISQRNLPISWANYSYGSMRLVLESTNQKQLENLLNSCSICQTKAPVDLIMINSKLPKIRANIRTLTATRSRGRLKNEEFERLIEIIPFLWELNLWHFSKDKEHVKRISQACINSSLKSITMEIDYTFTQDVWLLMCQMIAKGNIIKLYFETMSESYPLNKTIVNKLHEAIKLNGQLIEFTLAGTFLKAGDCNQILDALQSCPNLIHLNLSLNWFDDLCMDKLKGMHNLKVLDIGATDISDYGAHIIAEMIADPEHKISSIRLHINHVTDIGGLELFRAIESVHSQVKYLDMNDNDLSEDLCSQLDKLSTKKGIKIKN